MTILNSNLVCLDTAIASYAKLADLFLTEKRVKKRDLQLKCAC
jgi:hypothetical protein